ncbi:hypothetical protein [Candidatus Mesenet endosymbiont of Agriotes lineatus]
MISRLGTAITVEEIQNEIVKTIREEMVSECKRREEGWQKLIDEHQE